MGLAGAVGALAWALAVPGAQVGLSVAQAAGLADLPATASVAEPAGDGVTLPHLRAAGLPFPYWEDRFAWPAIGARTDRLGGRVETTVFYRRGHQVIAYTIVAGSSLHPGSGARRLVRDRTVLTIYAAAGGRWVVTWLRHGHTCVMSGSGVPLGALTVLATWRGNDRIPY